METFVYLHENGIAHRDVKLENVLIGFQNKEEIAIKIIDFGFSRCVFESHSESMTEAKENKKELSRKNSRGEE